MTLAVSQQEQANPAPARSLRPPWSPRLIQACLLGLLFAVSGGLYEAVVIDPAWPDNLALIQPEAGGVNRKAFWIPLHAALTILFPAALWAAWPDCSRRWPVLWALALYVAMRVWTGIYFIPVALQFEGRPDLTAAVSAEARTWVLWSLVRTPMVAAAAALLWKAGRRRPWRQTSAEGR